MNSIIKLLFLFVLCIVLSEAQSDGNSDDDWAQPQTTGADNDGRRHPNRNPVLGLATNVRNRVSNGSGQWVTRVRGILNDVRGRSQSILKDVMKSSGELSKQISPTLKRLKELEVERTQLVDKVYEVNKTFETMKENKRNELLDQKSIIAQEIERTPNNEPNLKKELEDEYNKVDEKITEVNKQKLVKEMRPYGLGDGYGRHMK